MKYLLDTCTISDFVRGEILNKMTILDFTQEDAQQASLIRSLLKQVNILIRCKNPS